MVPIAKKTGTLIVIDPAGKIIGRYDEGAASVTALDKKLAEIFK